MPATPAPSLSGSTAMTLLAALPLPSAAALELLRVHQPLRHPSAVTGVTKWLTRLNSSVASRDAAACEIAAAVVVQDEEGHAAAQCGKAWMGACLGALSSPSTPADTLPAFLSLARALVAAAPQAPTFEREVVQPAMGKLAVALGRLVERLDGQWDVLPSVLETTRALLLASPAPFRPTVAHLRMPLAAFVLAGSAVPEHTRLSAADVLAVLHLTGGKAAAPAAWGTDMRDALGGIAASLSAMAADAWEEENPRTAPLPPPASVPAFSPDPLVRTATALAALEGYTDIGLALLRAPASRPVPVPLAQIVASALRALNLSLDTPVAPHVSPQHHAALIAALPRVWNCGLYLLTAATSTGDHLVPHLGAILEHSVYLLERVPVTMTEARLQLLRFHSILLGVYPAAILPVEYMTRLLRFSLGVMGTVLDARPPPPATTQHSKGKKRARGAEDALVGGLEGRAPRPTSADEANVVVAAVELTPLIHPSPLLPPALLTFSIRLHLSLYLALPARASSFADRATHRALEAAVTRALQEAATLEAGGTARDVRALLLAVLPATPKFDLLLHPALPPMARPMPALAQLHMFAPETDDERKVRKELGFAAAGDADDEMDVDDEPVVVAAVQVQVPVVPVPVAPVPQAPVAHIFAAPVVAPTPAPAVAVAPAPVVVPAPPAAAHVEPSASASQQVPAAPAVPFMSTPSAKPPTAAAAAPAVPAPTAGDSDDEAIPDLDSGSDDDDDDEDDDDE